MPSRSPSSFMSCRAEFCVHCTSPMWTHFTTNPIFWVCLGTFAYYKLLLVHLAVGHIFNTSIKVWQFCFCISIALTATAFHDFLLFAACTPLFFMFFFSSAQLAAAFSTKTGIYPFLNRAGVKLTQGCSHCQ